EGCQVRHPVLEGGGQQEAGHDLGAHLGHPDLLEQLGPIAVIALLVGLRPTRVPPRGVGFPPDARRVGQCDLSAWINSSFFMSLYPSMPSSLARSCSSSTVRSS